MWQRGEQNRPAQLVEGKRSFSLFLIRGLCVTGDDRYAETSKYEWIYVFGHYLFFQESMS